MKKLKFTARRIKYYIKWHLHYLKLKRRVFRFDKTNILTEEELTNVLVIVPHADDEWLGASQVLLNASSCTVYYLNFQGNNYTVRNEENRLKELKIMQAKLKFKLMVSSSFKDYSDLESLMKQNNFSKVFIPFFLDWHKEHRKANRIAFDILKNWKPVNYAFYHITVPLPMQVSKRYITMDKKAVLTKVKFFKEIYKSQCNTPVIRFILQNRLWGNSTPFYAIECFAELTIDTWEIYLELIETKFLKETENLVNYIDDLYEIRRKSDELYEKILQC